MTGAVLAGALLVPQAAAMGIDGYKDKDKQKKCGKLSTSLAVVDFGTSFQGTEFRVTSDREGEAFLNDDRNPGVWVDLDVVPGAPPCVVDTAVAVTEPGSGTNPPRTAQRLHVDLLTDTGILYEAECRYDGTPFDASNLAAACGAGFTPVPGTPV
ncbi:hypothetical protein [Streptomyces sp. NPDC000410]|uniref:hypothetical protein n=1 Tax=Streptomyces sp. NPDC000410 TaxID=3154254 RepID=UPI00332B7BC0